MLTGGSVLEAVDSTGASTEFGEPIDTLHYGSSVWWQWTSPAEGLVRIEASASGPVLLTVWQGLEPSSLSEVTSTNNFSGPTARGDSGSLILMVRAGEAVQISLAGAKEHYVWPDAERIFEGILELSIDLSTLKVVEPAEGSVAKSESPTNFQVTAPLPDIEGSISGLSFAVLWDDSGHVAHRAQPSGPEMLTASLTNLAAGNYRVFAQGTNAAGRPLITPTNSFGVRPANDDFSDARVVSELPYAEFYRFQNAGVEPREPTVPQEGAPQSLWWKLIAPRNGDLMTCGGAALAAFAEDTLGDLVLIASGDQGSLRIPVTAGETVFLRSAPRRIDGLVDRSSSVSLALRPNNDDFATARVLVGGMVQDLGDLGSATTEPGEPMDTNRFGNTVWWRWTAPADGRATVRVDGRFFTLGAAVWRGEALKDLTLVTTWRDGSTPMAPLASGLSVPALFFQADAGETYHLSVGYDRNVPVARSVFDRVAIYWDLLTVQIMRPTNGVVLLHPTELEVLLSPPSPVIEGEIQGWAVEARALPGSAYGPPDWGFFKVPVDPASRTVRFADLPPGNYSLWTSATNGAGRLMTSEPVQARIRPRNDDFIAATRVTSLPFGEGFLLSSAGNEPGEPVLADQGGTGSVWWYWDATSDAVLVATAKAALGCFAGDSMLGLEPVGTRAGDVLRLPARAGVRYYFKISPPGNSGWFALQPAWPNDDFGSRVPLVGDELAVEVPRVTASMEPGEPFHGWQPEGVSALWWSWTAQADGFLLTRRQPNASVSNPDALCEAFSGTTVDTLTRRRWDEQGDVFPGWQAARVQAGESIGLALNAGGAPTGVWFQLLFVPDPPPHGVSAVRLPDDGISCLLFSSIPGELLIVEESTDLENWTERYRRTSSPAGPTCLGLDYISESHAFFRIRREPGL